MLVIFKCKAAGNIIMYEENAKPILELLGKEVKQGIILAAETGNAIVMLEEEIARRTAIEEEQKAEREESFDDNPKREIVEPVSFAARVYPLMDMLKRAQQKNKDIVWGV